ncbi:hypothetical protein [Mycobacterium sp.]|uniref:hypothetical protein n=1 Tax=Mycobacterium sp. TaxID=1785 RepID=UPI0031DEAC12
MSDAPDLSHVPAEVLAAHAVESRPRPGESHGDWSARARRLWSELLHKHPAPVETPPEVRVGSALAGDQGEGAGS